MVESSKGGAGGRIQGDFDDVLHNDLDSSHDGPYDMLERTVRSVRLGLVSAWIAEDYTRQVMAGVWDGARRRGAGVISFFGGRLPAVDPLERGRQLVYDLISPAIVEGLVVFAGPTFTSVDGWNNFRRFVAPLPMVTVGDIAPDVPCVVVDNATGLRQEILHLIEVHHRHRIACITGPLYNREAQIRLSVYEEVITTKNLAKDESLIVPGAFDEPSGAEGVRELLARGAVFDALVCCNDAMAFGAIAALSERGLRVPEDVSVVGFDDLYAMSSNPSLTSVRQPAFDIGKTAAHLLIDSLEGKSVPLRTEMPTTTITRRSCGCDPTDRMVLRSTRTGPDFARTRRDELARFLADQKVPGAERMPELLDAFWADFDEGSAFVHLFEDVVTDLAERGQDPSIWLRVLQLLREAVLPDMQGESQRLVGESLLHAAGAILADVLHRTMTRQSIDQNCRIQVITHLGRLMAVQDSLPALFAQLPAAMQALHIPTCQLAIFESDPSQCRLVVRYEKGREVALAEQGVVFATRDLLPQLDLFSSDPEQVVVLPLSALDQRIGFLLVRADQRDAYFLLILQQQLVSNLQRLERETLIARLHSTEMARAAELESAYEMLKQNQDQLVSAEKMASLGRLTAGIAHEMNTPLGAVRAAISELMGLVDEYRESMASTEVTPRDHLEIAQEMRQALGIAESAAARAAAFVRSIKSQTRDMSRQDDRAFDPVAISREALLLVQHALRSNNCRVDLAAPERQLELNGPPARFSQLITNLLTNAIDALKPKGGGLIRLSFRVDARGTSIAVSDDGVGIPQENMAKIFDPMFTTKRFGEGTGLGLSLARDIARADFAGTIDVRSTLGQGTTFTITIPRPATPPEGSRNTTG